MSKGIIVAICLSLTACAVAGDCFTFYDDLCPGSANCKCTLSESCGSTTKNASAARASDGGCSGQCRQVLDGDCPGDASCLYDDGPCSGPAPPPVSTCQRFYDDLCPGSTNCKCTLGESCSADGNISAAKTADGGCSGQCRQVLDGDCPGDASCLYDDGPCSGPAPPPPPSTCQTFYDGLCPGSTDCKCTLGESCDGVARNSSEARSSTGGCSGQCRQVIPGDCPGGSLCLLDAGACYQPPPPGSGALGGDVSTYVSSSKWSCAAQKGWSFMVVRSYWSIGAPDPNALPTLREAAAGGIPTRDIYHFPCTSVGAAQQMQDDVNAVGKGSFGTLWFDIETNYSPNCGWSSDLGSNCNFLQEMINEGDALGIQMGIYASSYMWGSIMGSGCTVGKSLPLWYAHYDGTRSFNDFAPFGGWSSPTMKQYNDGSSIGSDCGISADADYRV